MKIQHIEMFLQAAETGSITDAAINLGKSRTTVSAALNVLEKHLGVQLFMRSGNSISLTAIGNSVADDCTRLLSFAEQIQTKCSNHTIDEIP